jgi:hypothetical protein
LSVFVCVYTSARESARLTSWVVSRDSRSVNVEPSVTMSSRLRLFATSTRG